MFGQPGFSGTARFRLDAQLGDGAMGVVYRAFDEERGAPVALKLLSEQRAEALVRFKREFRLLKEVRHPHLVHLGELFEQDGRWFYTMELIDGVDFLRHVGAVSSSLAERRTELQRPSGRLAAASEPPPIAPPTTMDCDEARLRVALGQLALGVHALHSAGYVHRDIKPPNILVTDGPRVVLLDFGLISESSDIRGSLDTDLIIGTPAYMAPEQARGDVETPAVDWYSVGIVLYEALTGCLPFDGSAFELILRKQTGEPLPPSALIAGVPRDLDELCAALIRRDPRDRPTGPEVLRRLGLGPAAPAPARRATMQSQFIGRDPELATLRRGLADADAGRTVAVRIHGESGVGKSSLVRSFLKEVRTIRDAVVLEGRCYQHESLPYKAFDGLLDDLARHLRHLESFEVVRVLPIEAELLVKVFPVLGTVEALRAAPGGNAAHDPQERRRLVFAALRELLDRLAERGPLVLVIDDAQWADDDSLALLRYLLQPPVPPRLLLIAIERAGGDRLRAVLPDDVLEIDVGPLPPLAAETLVQRLADQSGLRDQGLPAHIAAAAAGHPLYIAEMVRHAAAHGVGDPGASVQLHEAIWARVAALTPAQAALVAVVCVADAPLSFATLVAAGGGDQAQVERDLAHLRSDNLLRTAGTRFEPYHDHVRNAVLSHLAAGERARHGRQLAEALEASDEARARPELMVQPLADSGRRADAARYAIEAARRAADALAFGRAAELYERGLALGSFDDDARRQLLLACAAAAVQAGRGAPAADIYLAAADGAPPEMRIDCQARAAKQLLTTGHVERGLAVIRDLLADVGEDLPHGRRRTLAAFLTRRAHLRLRGHRFRTRAEAEIPVLALRRQDVFQAVSHGLSFIDPVVGQLFQTRSLLEALRLGEPMRIARGFGFDAMYLSSARPARARLVLARCEALAAQVKSPYLDALAVGARGVVAYFEGDFPAACALLAEAERRFLAQPIEAALEASNTRMFHLLALRAMGDLRGLRAVLARGLDDARARGDLFNDTTLKRAFVLVWLADGAPARARATLDSATWVPPTGNYHVQHWYDVRARHELALYEGASPADHDALAPALRDTRASLLMRVSAIRVEVDWLDARSRLARIDAGADASGLDDVLRLAEALHQEPLAYVQPWADLLAAAVAHRRGDRDAAIAALRRAAERADACHLGLCAAAARWRLAGLLDGAESDALRAAAGGWMRDQGIADVEAMARTIAPGFAAPR